MAQSNSPGAWSAPNPQGLFGVTPLPNQTLPAGETVTINALAAANIRGLQADVQSVFCDASLAPDPVVIKSQLTGQYTIWPPGKFGWQQLLVPMPANILIRCTAACVVGLQVATGVMPAGLYDGGIIRSSETSVRYDRNASVADQVLLAANVQRQGYSLFNESAATLYLLNNSGVSSPTNYSLQVAPMGYFECPYAYGGEVRGIWSAAVGGARITEFL